VETNDKQREFIQLLTRHQPCLHGYILSLMRGMNESEDVLQNTNLVLWEKMDQFELGTNFKAWSFKVARLQVMAYRKKMGRQSWLCFEDDILDQFEAELPDALDDFEQRHVALRTCVKKLREKDQELLLCRYTKTMKMKDYAQMVGRSIGSLRATLYRLRHTLKACIEEQLPVEGR
jgi:RNA polymerase sigma-70 factor (ECF subfamily)